MSTWKSLTDAQYKVSSAWKDFLGGYYKVGGIWKKFFPDIPANMIVLFKAVPGSPWSVVSSPALDDRYPKCHSAQGSAGGSHTHAHASSSFYTEGTGAASRSQGLYSGGMLNHSHIYTHGHVAATNHEPQWYGLCPATGGYLIPISGYIFYDGFVNPDGWESDSALFDKFIKFKTSAPGGTGGNLTHPHSITLSTLAVDSWINNSALGSAVAARTNHNHIATHTHSSSNNLYYQTLRPIHPISSASKIPSGAVAFFVGSVVPYGWTQFVVANGRYIKMASAAGTNGGATTHTMAHSGNVIARSTDWVAPRSSGFSYVLSLAHVHAHSSANHVSATLEPKYQQLLVCKKD